VTGDAEIILKGGKIIPLDQYPNFTDLVTDSDGDGLADSEELIRSGNLTFMDFTMVAQHYGMTVPAGARALIPIWDYIADPSMESTNGTGVLDSLANPISIRRSLYDRAGAAEAVVFVPDSKISEFGFRERNGNITARRTRSNNKPKGFRSLFSQGHHIIGGNVFVYVPVRTHTQSQAQIHFNAFMAETAAKVGPGVKLDFVAHRTGVRFVQSYQTNNTNRVDRVFAIDRSMSAAGRTTRGLVAAHGITSQNAGRYFIIPRAATSRNFPVGHMQELVMDNNRIRILPWELIVTHNPSTQKIGNMKVPVGEIVALNTVIYPWFANEDIYKIKRELQKDREHVVELLDDDKIEGSPLNRGMSSSARITYNVESDSYTGKRGDPKSPKRVRFKVAVEAGKSGIRVLPSSEDENFKNVVLNHLRELTNIPLRYAANSNYIECAPGATPPGKAKGDELINNLLNSGQTVTIRDGILHEHGPINIHVPTSRRDILRQNRQNATVWYLPYITNIPAPVEIIGGSGWEMRNTPVEIILGHELIHAEAVMNARTGFVSDSFLFPPAGVDSYYDLFENLVVARVDVVELAVIGLAENNPIAANDYPVTENDLRVMLGFPRRIRYG
jgi:hypothetical protein